MRRKWCRKARFSQLLELEFITFFFSLLRSDCFCDRREQSCDHQWTARTRFILGYFFFPSFFSMRFLAASVAVFLVIVAVELAILVPVIVTQRAADVAQARVTLDGLMDHFAETVKEALGQLTYNVARTAAAATVAGRRWFSQRDLSLSLQLPLNPTLTSLETYIWTPLVTADRRSSYESFYGHNISVYENGTKRPSPDMDYYYPYALFEPPSASFNAIEGFDFLSNPRSRAYLRNKTLHLVPHSSINRTLPNSFGLVIVVREQNGRGYALGLAPAIDLLSVSLPVPAHLVTMAAFDTSVAPSEQLLHLDMSPLLANATTVADFHALPWSGEFFKRSIPLVGDDILLALRFDESLAATYEGTRWIVLVAVLVPICIVLDAIYWVAVLMVRQRLAAAREEKIKRESTQMMLGYVNHEIRNPLQTILGLGDLCIEELEEDSDGNERLISNLSSMVRAAEFIEHIASDVLDIRRIEEGKIQLDIAELDLPRFLSGMEKAAQQLVKPGIAFSIICDPDITTVRTDRYRLEQVLMNFLTNAFKHTDEGSVVLSLSLLSSGQLIISVSDTGRGIPQELKAKMFEQFSQVSTNDATLLGGFGLGLYLTRILAQLLGGSVGFESTLGKGSTFWIKLPYEKEWRTLGAQFEDSLVYFSKSTKTSIDEKKN